MTISYKKNYNICHMLYESTSRIFLEMKSKVIHLLQDIKEEKK